MKRGNIMSALLCVCAILVHFAAQRASAEYYLPPVAEEFFILSDRWNIEILDSAAGRYSTKLKLEHAKRKFVWDVDLMRLADKIDSNLICTGQYQEKMRSYLQNIQKSAAGRPLSVELISIKKGGPLIVAGITSFDAEKSFAGAPASLARFGLTAGEAKQINSAPALEPALRKLSERSWKTLEQRPSP